MMQRFRVPWLLVLTIPSAACSSLGGAKSGGELSATGPSIVEVRTEPGTFELSPNWYPVAPAKIVAQVKDFTSNIQDVRLRFNKVPLQIAMTRIGGTSWEATLSPQQLQTLAVGGKTMRYEANVIARNEDGLITVSPDPVQVRVKAPVPPAPAPGAAAGQAGDPPSS
jgi:hypothetical protein